ncbi:hypothetical protein EGW08_013568 [Elysia chlorotica]|uniref:Uncharacterized protein n=1 Tax=Elysia chlorotica TaxID=188477 RepID=A0A433TAX3_ELYCH|nr:hypothetical protein EGW08_013568 [Elysia chlorotica]
MPILKLEDVSEQLYELTLTQCPVNLSDFIDCSEYFSTEKFEETTFTAAYVDKEGIEVIPSSNPDSECYGSELFSPQEHAPIKVFREDFSRHTKPAFMLSFICAQKMHKQDKMMASAHIQQNVLFVMFQLLILSVLDYGLGCLTLSEANLLKLERLQNEAMRTVLGCTRDTHIICMRFLLDLSSVRIRHKLAQAKTYLRVMENPHHPLYPSLLTQKGTRIKRGKSWMAEAEDSIKLVCPIEDIIDGREWIKTGPEQTALTKVIITMGRDRRECAAAVTEQDIRQLIHDNSKRHDPIIYTDGSVKRGIQSGWGFVCYTAQEFTLEPDHSEEMGHSLLEKPFGDCMDKDYVMSVAHLDSCRSMLDETDHASFFLNLNSCDLTNSPAPEDMRPLKKEKTPLLELKETDIVDSENVKMHHSIIHDVVKDLELVPDEDVNSEVQFLVLKEKKEIEFSLWQKEKTVDEMQIPEPQLSPPEMPYNPLKEAIDLISLEPDKLNLTVSKLPLEQSNVTVPLLHIGYSRSEMDLPKMKTGEEFEKNNILEMEEQAKPKTRNVCQEMEENNPLDSFLNLRLDKKLKGPDILEAKPSSKAQVDEPKSNIDHQSLQQGFEIRIQPVPFRGPLDDILQCLVDSAAPYMEYMKQTQCISAKETLMSMSVDATRFLFKESEKKALDQEISDDASLQNSLCLHTLRTAAHLLVNASVEACCAYLVAQKEKWKEYFKALQNVKSAGTPFTVICSNAISHNKQLLCMLEARYNIFVVERDFSKLQKKGLRGSFADIIFSKTHCAVLLSLTEMDQQWNMEKVVKRYLALGLQYSYIFIIAHAIGWTTGYPLGKETVTNIHKLRASLSNLTKSSDYFDAQYKILIRLTETDVAFSIRDLANMYISSHKDFDSERSWLSADISQFVDHVTSKWRQSGRNGPSISKTSPAPTTASTAHSGSVFATKQQTEKEQEFFLKKCSSGEKRLERIHPMRDLVSINRPPLSSSCHNRQESFATKIPTGEPGSELKRYEDNVTSAESFPHCGTVFQGTVVQHPSEFYNNTSQSLPRKPMGVQSTLGDTSYGRKGIPVIDRRISLPQEQASRAERNEEFNTTRNSGFSQSVLCLSDCYQRCPSDLAGSEASWVYPGASFDTNLKDQRYRESNENAVSNLSAYQQRILAQTRVPQFSAINSSKIYSNNSRDRRSNFDSLKLHDQMGSNAYCLDNPYENLNSPVYNAQKHHSTAQYEYHEEMDGLSLLKEPEEQETFFGSSYQIGNSQGSKPCSLNAGFDSHFQAPFDCIPIKQELTSNADTNWEGAVPDHPKKDRQKDKPLLNFECNNDTRNTYGIFSSTARRHGLELCSSLNQENCTKQDFMTETAVNPISLIKQIEPTMLHFDDSSLPFSVSKALKRHILQAEEQNLYKVPRMFQISQSGGAHRSDRITKGYNIESIPMETMPANNTLGITNEVPLFYRDENGSGQPWTELSNTKSKPVACAGINKSLESCAISEDNFKRLPQLHSSSYSGMNSTQQSYSNFCPPGHTVDIPKSTWPKDNEHALNRLSSSGYKYAHVSPRHKNENMSNPVQSLSSEKFEACQFENFPSKDRKFYDYSACPVAPIYMSKEDFYQTRHPVGNFNENSEYSDNTTRQARSPEKSNSFEHSTSPLNRAHRRTDVASDPRLTHQTINEVTNISASYDERSLERFPVCSDHVHAVSKAPSIGFSKWRKYESDIDETIPLGSRPASYGPCYKDPVEVSELQGPALSPTSHHQYPGYKTGLRHDFQLSKSSADLSPPISMSPVDVQPRRIDRSMPARTSDEDSKLKKWQLYLQQHTLTSHNSKD